MWQDKRAEIAQTFEAVGDQFRPPLRTGWLKYIQTAYYVGPVSAASSTGQGTLVVNHDDKE